MAWFPCNIGGGSPEPTPVPVSMNVKTTSTSGYTASVELSTYEDSRDVVYSTVMGESNAVVFGAVKLYYDSAWYLKAFTTCEYDGNTYDEGDLIRTWGYQVSVDMKIDYIEPARGNATMKQGTFVSATSQFGIVHVNVGFEPDLVMVRLPFGNNDTTSYWEKGMSWAETHAMWNLYPAESVLYYVELGRQSGETGIQAINNNGFSFMSNGANTQGVTCEYIAVKYEVPQPTGDVYTIEQGNTQNAEDATAVNAENGKLYMFFTGNHSGSFTNADLIVGSLNYFELLDGIGVAAAIIQATSNTITYDGAWTGNYSITEIDVLKNGVEDLSIECLDKSNSWVSNTSISANVGDYFLIADTVDNESGTIVGADVLLEEVLTSPPSAINVKIRIVKATSTAVSLSSGNNLYYRKFGLVKEI